MANLKQSKDFLAFRVANLKKFCEVCNDSNRELVLNRLNKNPDLFLDPNNVQTVCRHCFRVLAVLELNKLLKSACELCGSVKKLRVRRIKRLEKCKGLVLTMENTQTICRKCCNAAKKLKNEQLKIKEKSLIVYKNPRNSRQYRQFVRNNLKSCCELCKSNYRLELHHIITVKNNDKLLYDLANIKTLCHSCHKKQHRKVAKLV